MGKVGGDSLPKFVNALPRERTTRIRKTKTLMEKERKKKFGPT